MRSQEKRTGMGGPRKRNVHVSYQLGIRIAANANYTENPHAYARMHEYTWTHRNMHVHMSSGSQPECGWQAFALLNTTDKSWHTQPVLAWTPLDTLQPYGWISRASQIEIRIFVFCLSCSISHYVQTFSSRHSPLPHNPLLNNWNDLWWGTLLYSAFLSDMSLA